MPVINLDKIDKRILSALQANSRITNLELADLIGLSPTPCGRRVKRLMGSGLIRKYVTLLDQYMLGLTLTAHISVTMDRHTPDRFEGFEDTIKSYSEVIACSIVTGQSADFLVTAVVPDMAYYERFLLGKLTRIDGVSAVLSSFELRRVVDRTALPLEYS